MTFNEALRCKKQFIRDSSSFTKSLYFCLITPANTEESEKYTTEFKNSPSSFIDESCKLYSSDAMFKVVVIPQKECNFGNSEEELSMNILA